jgi:hypothetical protein
MPYETSDAHLVSMKSSSGAVRSDTSSTSGLNEAAWWDEYRQCHKRELVRVMVPKRVRKVIVWWPLMRSVLPQVWGNRCDVGQTPWLAVPALAAEAS